MSTGEGRRSLEWYAEHFSMSYLDGRAVPLEEWPVSRVLRGESFVGVELRISPRSGAPWVAAFSGKLVKNSILLGVVTFQDVSDRVEAEQGFRAAFHASPSPTSIIRLSDGTFVDVNATFAELVGYERDELLGRNPAELNLHVETEKRNLVLQRNLTPGESLPPLERYLRRKDGHQILISTSGEVIAIGGEPHLLDTFINLTEQRRTEEELLQAIEEVMRDTNWFSRSVVEKLANLKVRAQDGEPAIEIRELTRRERQVLGALAQGFNNDQIAESLDISRNTVRNYVAGVYSKLAVSSRAEAVVWARERGITN
ncbi:hypothetical protein BH24DEI2_BH24DEI2_09690 [soil metagenome]